MAKIIQKVLLLQISEYQHQLESVNTSVQLELPDGLHLNNGLENLWNGEWTESKIIIALPDESFEMKTF